MSGDTYRAPGLSWLHLGRKLGAAGLTLPDSLGATSKTKNALIDSMAGRLVVWAATGAKAVRFEQSDATYREPVNRLVILAGHNCANAKVKILTSTNNWSSSSEVLPYTRLRGATAVTAARGLHAGVNVIDFPDVSSKYLAVEIGQIGAVPEVGEVIFTRHWTPTYGLDPGYEDSLVPNVKVQELPSGINLTLQRGPAKRRWKIDTVEDLSGADRAVWESLIHEVGVNRDAFLWEGTRAYETTLDDFTGYADTTALNLVWTIAGAGVANMTTTDFDGDSKACLFQCAVGEDINAARLITSTDMRRCVLKFALRCTSRGYLSSSSGLWVYLSSGGNRTSFWAFGTDLIRADATFYQLSVDLDNDAVAIAGNSGPCDLADVRTIGFVVDTSGEAVPRTIFVDDIHLLHKDTEPIWARIIDAPDVKQTDDDPSANGEYRQFSMTIEEAVG